MGIKLSTEVGGAYENRNYGEITITNGAEKYIYAFFIEDDGNTIRFRNNSQNFLYLQINDGSGNIIMDNWSDEDLKNKTYTFAAIYPGDDGDDTLQNVYYNTNNNNCYLFTIFGFGIGINNKAYIIGDSKPSFEYLSIKSLANFKIIKEESNFTIDEDGSQILQITIQNNGDLDASGYEEIDGKFYDFHRLIQVTNDQNISEKIGDFTKDKYILDGGKKYYPKNIVSGNLITTSINQFTITNSNYSIVKLPYDVNKTLGISITPPLKAQEKITFTIKFNKEYGGFIDPGSYCFSADDLHYLGTNGEGDTKEFIDNTPFETSDNYFIFDVKSTHTISQYVSIELKQSGHEDEDTNAIFTFSRSVNSNSSNDYITGDLTINYILHGTATEGVDYVQITTKSVTIPDGQNSVDLSITINSDTITDPLESIIVIISDSSDYIIKPGKDRAITLIGEGVMSGLSTQNNHGEFKNSYAFAALKTDGSVVTWGDEDYGGDSSSVRLDLSSDVTQIFSTQYAFAALKANGSVVTWGVNWGGGDKSIYNPTTQTYTSVSSHLTEVTQIFSTSSAFAALKKNGSVVTWGNDDYGGTAPSKVNDAPDTSSDKVTQIFSTKVAFAALKNDGSVVTWGYDHGGVVGEIQIL